MAIGYFNVPLGLKESKNEYLPAKELLFGNGWYNFAFFIGMHIMTFVGLQFMPSSKAAWLLCAGTYYLRMFGITGGYHRYFAHKSFSTNRIFQFVLGWIGCMSVQKGPLWWASHHRHHHKYTDQEEDVHSPLWKGFLWAHCGWFLLSEDYGEVKWNYIPDLARYPELVWLEKFHIVPGIFLATISFLFGGWWGLFWGFIVSTTLLWHGTFTINSLAHVFGSRRFITTDTSKNNLFLSILTMGEGWHNNHHAWMTSVKAGLVWWEWDPTYYILSSLSAVGIVYKMKYVSQQQQDTKLITESRPDKFMESLQDLNMAHNRENRP